MNVSTPPFSGISATLLAGGRTIHSTFKVPLDTANKEFPTCNISKGTPLAKLLCIVSAIIFDECTMPHSSVFEAIDRTLQDIKGCKTEFGGIPVLFCGDYRQILPVVRNARRGQIVSATLKRSLLWKNIAVRQLTINMRARLSADPNEEQFCEQLLQLGEGKMECVEDTNTVVLPQSFGHCVFVASELEQTLYPDIALNFRNVDWLAERTILAPHNASVNSMNEALLQKIPGELFVCQSVDTADNDDESNLYPTEFLNSLPPAGLPQHNLHLKEGAPIIILRNLDPPRATNGTRCIVRKVHHFVLKVEIAVGDFKGEHILIPRIPLRPSASDLPFSFTRLQFPVRLCFSMTINKAQGQTFKHVGVDLREDCFSHGQLYVAASRTGSPSNLTFLLQTEGSRTTKNPVFKEIFNDN